MRYKDADQNIILDKSFKFALTTVQLARLLRDKREYVFANQLLKSGTSIGANVEEAVASVSRKEFHVKMSISSKEARETRYWLRLLKASQTLDSAEVDDAIQKITEIIRILTAIVKTT
ncbi:MAG: four helix bundle protein, partial [Cyclonatronaceae bacterium]